MWLWGRKTVFSFGWSNMEIMWRLGIEFGVILKNGLISVWFAVFSVM
jgi:hypothetical protein